MSDLKNQVVRLIEAGVPEQEIAGFIQKWDKGGAPEPPRSSFGRTLGLGARGVVEGIGDTINMLSAPNPTFTLARSLRNLKPELSEKMLGTTQIGEKSADALSLPAPATDNEKLGVAAVRGAASALPTLGAGAAFRAAGAAPKLASFLTAAPAEQLVSGAAGGAAAEAARQGGAGAGGQFVAGLAGGLSPSAAKLAGVGAGRTVRLTANMVDMLSDKGQKRAAGRKLRRVVGPDNVDEVLARIENREMPVEGVDQTLAQLTLSPRVAVMEKGLESSGVEGADLIAHYTAQRDARQKLAEELLDSMEARQTERVATDEQRVSDAYRQVEDTADAMWVNRDARGLPERVGPQVQGVYDELYQAQRQATRDAYKAIDADNTTSFNLAPLREMFNEHLPQGQFAPQMPADIRRFIGQMDEAIANGRTASYRDLQNVRTTLTDLAYQAQQTGDANMVRITQGMKRSLDNYLETAADYADIPVQPVPGSAAYRDARREASALAKARVQADSPFWDSVWKHLDADSLARDFPDAKRELAQLHGRGIFARKGEGVPIDELADSLKIQGYLAPDADSSTLVELLKSKVRPKGRAAEELDDVLEHSAQFGTGFTPEQAQAFQRAKAMRREQGARFEQGYNENMSRGKVREAEVMSNYFRPGAAGASAAQDFQRAFAGDPRAMSAMRDYVLAQFLRDSMQDGRLSLTKMEAFFKRYDAALRQFPKLHDDIVNLVSQQTGADALAEAVAKRNKAASSLGKTVLQRDRKQNAKLIGREISDDVGRELVEKGLLSAAEVERLKGLTKSVERANRAMELAKVHGSPTSQNLATQDFLANILGDNIDSQGGFWNKAVTIPLNLALNPIVKNFYGDAAPGIARHLTKAAHNPEYAAELLRTGKRRNLKSVGDVLADRFKTQGNVQARSILDLLFEDDDKKKK